MYPTLFVRTFLCSCKLINKFSSKHVGCLELHIHEVRERIIEERLKLQKYLLPALATDRCVRFSLFHSWLICKLKLDKVLKRAGKGEGCKFVNLTDGNRKNSMCDGSI